jgi:hypothetical protein
MSHTKGKLSLNKYGNIKTEAGDDFRLNGATLSGNDVALANTRRLVACWNALDGVPTEWLENYVSGNAENVLQENAALVKERDELVASLREITDFASRQVCQHEETHRGGSIWEICDSCGEKWADDKGGKPVWRDPIEIENAINVLSKYPEAS